MDTEVLIRTLAAEGQVVTPLWRPWRRTLVWAAAAAVYLALLVVLASPRGDLDQRMQEPWFLIEQAAALLMGLSAAVAALSAQCFGAGRRSPRT